VKVNQFESYLELALRLFIFDVGEYSINKSTSLSGFCSPVANAVLFAQLLNYSNPPIAHKNTLPKVGGICMVDWSVISIKFTPLGELIRTRKLIIKFVFV